MLLKKIENETFFQWPDHKLGTHDKTKDKRMYCTYHQGQGHYTTACKSFKAYLKTLTTIGNLDGYIDQEKTLAQAQNSGIAAATLEEPVIIHVIHGPVTKIMKERLHKEINRTTSAMQVLSVGQALKRKLPTKDSQWTITVTEKDLEGVQFLHNDALVITLGVHKATVKRILVTKGVQPR